MISLRRIIEEEIERCLIMEKGRARKAGQKTKKTKSKKSDRKRRSVLRALDDPKINNAQLAYKVFKNSKASKDSKRSLFSKKAREVKDKRGRKRRFTNSEINIIANLIDTIDA